MVGKPEEVVAQIADLGYNTFLDELTPLAWKRACEYNR
jgi:hypothetical protein